MFAYLIWGASKYSFLISHIHTGAESAQQLDTEYHNLKYIFTNIGVKEYLYNCLFSHFCQFPHDGEQETLDNAIAQRQVDDGHRPNPEI